MNQVKAIVEITAEYITARDSDVQLSNISGILLTCVAHDEPKPMMLRSMAHQLRSMGQDKAADAIEGAVALIAREAIDQLQEVQE